VSYEEIVAWAPKVIEGAGIVVIVVGAGLATALFALVLIRREPYLDAYRLYRQRLGQAILLGLEFLVAADIIHSVAITPSFVSVGVLAIIVLIRTFLSLSLELEIEGRWPWQPRRAPTPGGEARRSPPAT
jgi:uncharacterized membrane protein